MIGTGISYTQLSEKMTFNKQYISDKDGHYVTEVNKVDPTLSLVGNNSEDHVYNLVTRDLLHYNQYRFVDIPLSVQVKLIDNRLDLSTYLTTSFNVWNNHSGFILDHNYVPMELGSSVKQTVGMEFSGGMELGYALSDSFGLIGRAQVSSRGLSFNGIDRRMIMPEMYIGIKFDF